MNLFEMAIRLTTVGEDEMRDSLATVSAQGKETAQTLSQDLTKGWEHVIERVIELISIWEAAELFKHMIEESAELAVKLERESQMWGISAERIAELGEAAELLYVPVDAVGTAMRRLSIAMTDSGSKGGEAMAAMGLNVKAFHNDAGAALDAIAEKFATFKDDANKSALAIEIFGRGGLAMIPLLNNLAETTKQVKELGQTMTAEQKESMLNYEQAMIRLHIVTDGYSRQVAEAAAGPLAELARAFTVSVKNGEEFNIVAEALAGTIRFLATIVLLLKDAFVIVGHQMGDFFAAAAHGVEGLGTLFMDVVTGNFKKVGDDAKTMMDRISKDADEANRDIVSDFKEAGHELQRLYGFRDAEPTGTKRAGGTKSAPNAAKDTKGDELLKAKYDYEVQLAKENYDKIEALDNAYLATVIARHGKGSKEAFDEMKVIEEHKQKHNQVLAALDEARYRGQLALAEQGYTDETKSTEEVNQKIVQLDGEYMQRIIVLYGIESKEYEAQMKVMAAHRKQYEDEKLKWAKWGAAQLKQVEDDQKNRDLADAQEKLRMAQQSAHEISSAISAAFTAGLGKGGTGWGAGLRAMGASILSTLGEIFIQMGEKLLLSAPIFAMIRAGLSNIFTAPESFAIGGAALIALGAALNAIGSGSASGGGGSGAASSFNAAAVPADFSSSFGIGNSSTTTAAGMKPVQPVSVTVIGPKDAQAQRQILELIGNAERRGS